MQLEQLCSALQAPHPGLPQRLPFAFGLRFPLWPLLRKELAEFYIAMGFVGACAWMWLARVHGRQGRGGGGPSRAHETRTAVLGCHAPPTRMRAHAVHTPGAALRVFESLEMWDQLIVCYRLLGKKAVAQELVLSRLKVGARVPGGCGLCAARAHNSLRAAGTACVECVHVASGVCGMAPAAWFGVN
jgi:hypothetical protein